MEQRWVVDPVLRQRYSFAPTTAADGAQALLVEIWLEPGGGVTPHLHPALEERFTVLVGQAQFLRGRRWEDAGPATDAVVVPAGVRHAYRNRGDEPAHIVCTVTPPSTLQAFLEEAAALNRAGRLTRRAFPKSLGALLAGARLAHRHREMVVLLFPPFPPPAIQRFLVPALARLGRRVG